MVSSSALVLFLTVLVAAIVELVEALTIVLAIGVTRGWRSTLLGLSTALVTLVGVSAALGPALRLIPLRELHFVIGALLLIFGLQWLKQAILRAGGFLALHDEAAAYQAEMTEAKSLGVTPGPARIDWAAFTIVAKGVLLEGFEVVFIMLSFGTTQQHLTIAITAALTGLIIVGLAGLLLHRPLTKLPENNLKFLVGLMLTTFGTYWSAIGVGISWPGNNAALLGILIAVTVVAIGMVAWLRQIAVPQS